MWEILRDILPRGLSIVVRYFAFRVFYDELKRDDFKGSPPLTVCSPPDRYSGQVSEAKATMRRKKNNA